MIPGRGRRGGRGYTSQSPGRGRGRDNVLVQHGDKKLIAANLSPSLYDEFQKFLEKKNINAESTSYADTLLSEDSLQSYHTNTKTEVILLLEDKDLKWENDPWKLMTRYLTAASYPATSYKGRMYYESILKASGCEITHFYSNRVQNVFNFSKIIIRQLIAAEDWGMSPMQEKDLIISESQGSLKYNYWDYIDALHKVFYYENPNRKHSWFIKICGEVYNHHIPNWFINWWHNMGPSWEILPEKLSLLYKEWVKISPQIQERIEANACSEVISSMMFFIEFSVPWIWKFVPIVDKTAEGIPCLRRSNYTKFWEKMLKTNPDDNKLYGQETLDLINQKIISYRDHKKTTEISPFKQTTMKLKLAGTPMTRKELMKAYMEDLKKELKNFEDNTSDVSMASSSKSNKDTVLAGESQDPYEDEEISDEEMEQLLQEYHDMVDK